METPVKESQSLQTSPAPSDDAEYTQRFPVIQTVDDAQDFYFRIRASNIRKVREQLSKLIAQKFPWPEILLAIATTAMGGTIGAAAGNVKLTSETIPIIFYIVFPSVCLASLVGWWSLRHQTIVNVNDIGNNIRTFLPEEEALSKTTKVQNLEIDEFSVISPIEAKEHATQVTANPSISKDWLIPEPDWSDRMFHIAYSLSADNDNNARLIDKAYLESQYGKDESGRIKWDGWKLYSKIISSAENDLFLQLRSLADKHPQNPHLNLYVARVYKNYSDHLQAAIYYEKAALTSEEGTFYLENIGYASVERWKGGDEVIARTLNNTVRIYDANTTDLKLSQLEADRRFLETIGEREQLLGVLELIVEISPLNHENRFALAYAYAEAGHHRLGVLHYQRIPLIARHPNTWNNLGVSLSALEINSLSVEAFEAAVSENHSLATSNLANEYATAGFIKQAKELIEREIINSERDENVDRSMVGIREAISKDERSLENVLKKAETIAAFNRRFGDSQFYEMPPNIDGRFASEDMVIDIKINGNYFSATGTRQTTLNRLAIIAKVGDGSHLENITINGNVRGGSVVGYLKKPDSKESEPSASTLLTGISNLTQVSLYISKDGDRIDMLEMPSESNAKTRTFLREIQ